VNKDRESEGTDESPEQVVTLSSDEEYEKQQNMPSCNMDVNSCIMEDMKRRNDNFMTPRRHLSNAILPVVDRNIQNYRIERLTSESNLKPHDPLIVDRVPPISVLEASQKALLKIVSKKNNKEIAGIHRSIFRLWMLYIGRVENSDRYDRIRTVSREVPEEIRWTAMAFERLPGRQDEGGGSAP